MVIEMRRVGTAPDPRGPDWPREIVFVPTSPEPPPPRPYRFDAPQIIVLLIGWVVLTGLAFLVREAIDIALMLVR